jgi:hypothetical protein
VYIAFNQLSSQIIFLLKKRCCACYELTFSTLENKKFIVQITNTGGDLGDNHFDLEIPGGGVGIFNGNIFQKAIPYYNWFRPNLKNKVEMFCSTL